MTKTKTQQFQDRDSAASRPRFSSFKNKTKTQQFQGQDQDSAVSRTRPRLSSFKNKTKTKTLMSKAKTETQYLQDQYWKSLTGMDCDKQKD